MNSKKWLLAILTVTFSQWSLAVTECNKGTCIGVLRQGETLSVSPPNDWAFSGKGQCTFKVEGISSKVKGAHYTVSGKAGTTQEWDCSDGVQSPGSYDMLNAGTFKFTFVNGLSSPGESCGKVDIEKATPVANSTLRYECKYLGYAPRR